MSRKFLTAVGLPAGNQFPPSGTMGDMFFKSDELRLYLFDGIAWKLIQAEAGGGNEAALNITWWLGA